MDAMLIKSDGTTQKIKPKNGTDFKCAELYKLLGCDHIEVIYPYRYPDNGECIMIGDDEAKLVNKPTNLLATLVMCKGAPKLYDTVAGDVVYCHTSMLK